MCTQVQFLKAWSKNWRPRKTNVLNETLTKWCVICFLKSFFFYLCMGLLLWLSCTSPPDDLCTQKPYLLAKLPRNMTTWPVFILSRMACVGVKLLVWPLRKPCGSINTRIAQWICSVKLISRVTKIQISVQQPYWSLPSSPAWTIPVCKTRAMATTQPQTARSSDVATSLVFSVQGRVVERSTSRWRPGFFVAGIYPCRL